MNNTKKEKKDYVFTIDTFARRFLIYLANQPTQSQMKWACNYALNYVWKNAKTVSVQVLCRSLYAILFKKHMSFDKRMHELCPEYSDNEILRFWRIFMSCFYSYDDLYTREDLEKISDQLHHYYLRSFCKNDTSSNHSLRQKLTNIAKEQTKLLHKFTALDYKSVDLRLKGKYVILAFLSVLQAKDKDSWSLLNHYYVNPKYVHLKTLPSDSKSRILNLQSDTMIHDSLDYALDHYGTPNKRCKRLLKDNQKFIFTKKDIKHLINNVPSYFVPIIKAGVKPATWVLKITNQND